MKRKRASLKAKAKLKKPLTDNDVINAGSEEPEDTSTTIKRVKQADSNIEKTDHEGIISHPDALGQIIASVIKEIDKDDGGLANLSRSLVGNSINNEQMGQPHVDRDLEEHERQHHQNPEFKQEELNAALQVIQMIMELEAADPFSKPVDPIALGIPDYLDVIKTPMDFGTICNNLENGLKYMNSADVFKDVEYIWYNCVKYNNKGDVILDLMKRVKTYFIKYWKAAGLHIEQPLAIDESSSLRHNEQEKDNQQTPLVNDSAHLQQKETSPNQSSESQPGQPQQSSNLSQSSSDPNISTPGSTNIQKNRQFQGLKHYKEPLDTVEPIKVSTNELGQPVGPEAAQLTKFVGLIAEDGNYAPFTYHNWSQIPQKIKENMWQTVLAKFDLDPVCKKWVLLSIRNRWRNFKSQLKVNRYDVHKADKERLADRDERVPPDQWAALVSHWSSEKSQAAFYDKESSSASEHDEDSKSQKRGRKKKSKTNEGKTIITYNIRGVPIGDGAAKLSNFLGLTARTMVPVGYASWLKVSEEIKEELWQHALTKFVLDPKSRKQVLQSIGNKWKNFKHKLYTSFIKTQKNDPEVNLLDPPTEYPHLKKEDWKLFVTQRLSEKWEDKSKKAKNMRAQHKYNHRLSRKGYAGLILEIMQETGKNEEEIDRATLWKKARELKSGGFDSNVQIVVDKIDELNNNSGSVGEVTYGTHDVLTQALGTEEKRGHVRGMGKFVKPNQYFFVPKAAKQYLEAGKKEMDQRLKKLEDELEKLKRVKNHVSKEAESCQMWGNKDFEDEPRGELLDNSCFLAIDVGSNIVATGTIMKYSVSGENIEVMMEVCVQGEALLPIPLEEEFIVKVKDAVGHILSWPRHLVIRCSDLAKVGVNPRRENEKPIKELASKKGKKRQRESDEESGNENGNEKHKGKELESKKAKKEQRESDEESENENRKEKHIEKELESKKVKEQHRESDEESENENIKEKHTEKELKSLKAKKQQREFDEEIEKENGKEKETRKEVNEKEAAQTRSQIKTRIRIENSAVLKMSAMMVDKQVSKVDSIKLQCEDDLFGFESYTYLAWDDFQAVFTLDELSGAVIISYMMYLYEQINNGSKRDSGICFVNPTTTSPRERKAKSKNINDASRSIANRLSKRKDNDDIILLPYNLGKHWVMAVIDMKANTCYYLDSSRPNNVNSLLKQIIDAAMAIYAKQSGSKKRVKFTWVNATCPRQPGITECGYYMLKFMKEIVDEGVEILVNDNVGGSKDEYTDADIDGIREEWLVFVTNFIFR